MSDPATGASAAEAWPAVEATGNPAAPGDPGRARAQEAATVGPDDLASPGWYHDDNAMIRWWNGSGWDVGAPPPAPPMHGYGYGYGPVPMTENRSMAMLAHLGAFVGGFVLPLVIMVTTGKTDPYVRHHATESLDFQLTYLTFVLAGFALSLLTFGFGLIVFIPLLFIVAIGHIVFAIQGCIAANRGEWYRYPICIRYVKHT